jgi:hypothetical protein
LSKSQGLVQLEGYKYIITTTAVLIGKWAEESWCSLFKIPFWEPLSGRRLIDTENSITEEVRNIISRRNFHPSFIVSRP